MKCAACTHKKCHTEGQNCLGEEVLGMKELEEDPVKKKMHTVAATLEAHYYMKKTRLEEVIMFIKEMGYTRIGVAFCRGLSNEAKVLNDILSQHFEVVSVCCKICGIDKKELNLPHIKEGRRETSCNPIAQATILNRAQTQLNLLVGLCIGHDILFTQHCHAPVTTLIVKDRVLTHNPAGAIYSDYYLKNVF